MNDVAYVLRHYYTCADCGIASHIPDGENGDVDEHPCPVCQVVTEREYYYSRTAGIRPENVNENDTVVPKSEVVSRGTE